MTTTVPHDPRELGLEWLPVPQACHGPETPNCFAGDLKTQASAREREAETERNELVVDLEELRSRLPRTESEGERRQETLASQSAEILQVNHTCADRWRDTVVGGVFTGAGVTLISRGGFVCFNVRCRNPRNSSSRTPSLWRRRRCAT
eukprot:SAG11_NODE_2410_length_3394_cov_2.519575_4_plen_148_part_00